MKAITFLGTADYKEVTYTYRGQEHTTRLFPEALCHFFPQIQTLYLFATPTVQEHTNLKELRKHIPSPPLEVVPIPEGHSEEHLWEIFDALTGRIDEEDRVVFDITHSFRSLPFLTFLAAAYLRAVRRVKIEAVVYGAYEARPKDDPAPRPVFDLTPFVDLLDWLTAANEFIYTGNARFLARLLGQAGENRHSNQLKRAGETLEEFSLAMMLCRPIEVMERAGRLRGTLDRAREDMAQWARPFAVIARRIEEEYSRYALPQPTDPEHTTESLRYQKGLIRWYLERGLVIQAVTLAREWLVTAVGWRRTGHFIIKYQMREAIEWGLSGLARQKWDQMADLNEWGQEIAGWPEKEEISLLWDTLSNVRNDLDHGGMREGPMQAIRLRRKAEEEILPRIEELAKAWGLG